MKNNQVRCALTGRMISTQKAVQVATLEQGFRDYVRKQYTQLTDEDHICLKEVGALQSSYLRALLTDDLIQLNDLEMEIDTTVATNPLLSIDIEEDDSQELTTGERVADKVASFGGSWPFIIIFFSFLIIWMSINAFVLHERGFDPYPFILLNLILSCLAAIQAPIIMMSQNRQAHKDRQQSEHDYKINMKAELEIKLLHKKLDHVLTYQNRRLLELQRVQTQMLEKLVNSMCPTETSAWTSMK